MAEARQLIVEAPGSSERNPFIAVHKSLSRMFDIAVAFLKENPDKDFYFQYTANPLSPRERAFFCGKLNLSGQVSLSNQKSQAVWIRIGLDQTFSDEWQRAMYGITQPWQKTQAVRDELERLLSPNFSNHDDIFYAVLRGMRKITAHLDEE